MLGIAIPFLTIAVVVAGLSLIGLAAFLTARAAHSILREYA